MTNDTQAAAQPQQITIPPMPLDLPWPVAELCLEGLGKLSIERAGQAHQALHGAMQQHLARVAAAHKQQQAAAKEAAPAPAAPAKTAQKAKKKR